MVIYLNTAIFNSKNGLYKVVSQKRLYRLKGSLKREIKNKMRINKITAKSQDFRGIVAGKFFRFGCSRFIENYQ